MIKDQKLERNSLVARFACIKKNKGYTDKILMEVDNDGKNYFEKN